ncbi:Arc family DNA-binding protein [Microlunatus sp. GCM10028923]|uniref:Arc family DNA-binding protein n=1 Tax=Microlunatus sp. GCM10028923 TaxID=3273400 RepID=UPI00361A82B0
MRTTMNLPDALMDEVRERAKAEHRTVTSLMIEALNDLLAKDRTVTEKYSLPTDGYPNGRMLIDIDDKDAVQQHFDEEDGWL